MAWAYCSHARAPYSQDGSVWMRACVRACVCVRVHGDGGGGGQAIWEGEEGLKAKVQRSVLSWVGWGGGGEGMEGVRREGELNCCPVLLIVIRVSNEWRASCKPLSGFFNHHADHSIEPPFYDEEGRACLYRSRRQASLPVV